MAAPLSPAPSAALNLSTPTANLRREACDDRRKPAGNTENHTSNDDISLDGDSSPFLSHVKDEVTSPTARGPSPPKARAGSRIISGSELSPLKILQQQQQSQIQAQTQAQAQAQSQPQGQNQTQQSPQSAHDETSSPAKSMPPPPLPQSPRKVGPIKRFPVKVSQPGSSARESPRRSLEERRSSGERQSSLQEVVLENEGLKHAIEIFEDEVNAMHDGADDADHEDGHTLLVSHGAAPGQGHLGEEEHSVLDDSMVSTFSAFSGVPNLTMLAQMRSDSPSKFSVMGASTPRAPRMEPPEASRTPRVNGSYDAGNNTTNLMDFTEQLRYGAYGAYPTPSRRGGAMPPSSSTAEANVAATPQRPNGSNNLVSLLDFDLPPAPTPRSIPSITPRELESLKSGFLSEISSLKASLSGKEAEVQSLKTAVGDAEKRVGECMEQLREVQGAQEALQAEKDSWERRGREMEAVLRKVKEEIVISQREREELEFKLDESEKRREAAEMMAQEAESKMAGMRAGKASAEAAAAAAGGAENKPPVAPPSHKEVEIAVERVARELHALYKSKHENKVAALKKSYEHRWEKRVHQLQAQVDELRRENEELRQLASRDSAAAHRGLDPARLAEMEEERRAERARDAAQIRELEATVEKVEAVLKTVQADNAELRVLLERERVEKGELVMLAEEMMNIQQSFIAAADEEPSDQQQQQQQPPHHQPQYQPQQQQQRSPPHHQQHQPQQQQQQQATKTPSKRQSYAGPSTSRTPGNSFRLSTSANNNNSSLANGFRASGLRAPGSVSGIPAPGVRASHERTKSAATMIGVGAAGGGSGSGSGSGLPRPGSGQGLRGVGASGIMSSIERMGAGGSHGSRGRFV
ncbi:uncharacterized protein THITE_2106353 [Thermothielavioides terrestris NRRL 8126]|uniref:Uncharacterized protein n=1 Tax=Thermothielavioides terrestris (strain ATCC 38088 / NRRL 8126) TaxID=578455 RepID=G2QX91_THETT|nr:uncharacterized protein THITE_2106353 [Thermothielavioides terrestris NRRL 8126]AEO62312.1 hypothetical protein THITE_2106353 [Thermothielavioides terrestris NRRL 8126]